MFSISNSVGQIAIFVALTALIALLTYWKVHGKAAQQRTSGGGSTKEVFLAGGGLTWLFVAGSITLTNLSTEQLVGMNGNQMLLLAWWELSGFVGLLILAYVFVPIYYRNNCTTVTELLERRYKGGSIRNHSFPTIREGQSLWRINGKPVVSWAIRSSIAGHWVWPAY